MPLLIKRKRDLTAGEIQTVDPSKKRDYQRRFREFALDVELHDSTIARMRYWRIFDPKTGAISDCGFDVDLDRYLVALSTGTPFAQVDLYRSANSPTGDRRIDSKATAGAPLCVVCGQPGGLPCPAMVAGALAKHFVLAVPLDSPAVTQTKHVHPGRCRKRLRAHLDHKVSP